MLTKIRKTAPLFALTILVLAGCATRIRLDAPRTPTLDTRSIQRVAVMPFVAPNHSHDAISLTNGLTSQMTNRLRATGVFTLVDSSVIVNARSRGVGIDNYVDALFQGRVTLFSATTSTRQEPRRDRATGETTMHTFFFREVEVAFDYYFVRAHDGTIIGPVSRRGRQTSRHDERHNLVPEMTLANRIIEGQLRAFHQDVVPHMVRVSRTLERERDRALRPHMDAALAQVRAGNYRLARDSYLAIWEAHGSMAAAINASILQEALGETEDAIVFMGQVLAATGNPRASTVLIRLNRELAEQRGVEAFGDALPPVERVAAHAIGEVQRILPMAARVSIHNNAAANQGLVNDVIDNMTSTFLRNGIPVIERQRIELILTEQNLHMDGSVSDRDFISVGNLAGANTIIIVGITGVGAARRLQVRVLDIETGTVVMQSDTGNDWRL